MISAPTYLIFLGACAALIAVPGPSQALVLARTLGEGPRSGALTAVGLNLGTLCHAMAAALGLSSILASSPLAFTLLQYAGGAYLVYLGIRALQPAAVNDSPAANGRGAGGRSPLVRGLATGVMNPKVALFFLAFLPQFVDPTGAVFLQFLLLGATLAVLDTCYELLVVWLVSRMRGAVSRSSRAVVWQRRTSGAALVALGLGLAARD